MSEDQKTTVQREITLTVNGVRSTLDIDPLTPLADVLRDNLRLTGTKLGCRAGDCGSCTVVLDDVPVTSCLVPVVHAHGRRVTTIEGASEDRSLRALQVGFAKNNACQCGYCIPGFIMASAPLVGTRTPLSRAQIATELSGNLCRCTGYDSIIDAVLDADTSMSMPENEDARNGSGAHE